MGQIFLKVLNMGLTASWLILAVMILRLFLKRAPRWTACLLWALVALKLICPFSIESALSLIPSSEPLPEKIMTGNTFQVDTGIGFVDVPVNDYLGDHYYEGVTVPLDNGNRVMNALGVIWITGVIIMLLYSFVSCYRLYRITRASICLRENIFQCDGIDTPFILGIVRPRIYLPSGMEKEQTEYVIAHERAHLKSRDHWWKPAGFLLLSVYWFQPLCWVSYILLSRDIEFACDEKVICALSGEGKKAYAEALLACSIRQNMVTACPLAFGEVGAKERIKNVLHYKKPAFWVLLAALFCCITAAVCFLTGPKEEGESTSTEEEIAVYMEDVRMRAEWYAKTAYEEALDGPYNYDYRSWRVKYWEKCYTYDDLERKVYEVYRFDYEFLSGSPEDVVLAGGMSVSKDGWVTPDYPDSRYLVYEKDGEQREFAVMLFENDCVPGDEVFTADLLAAVREQESEDTQSAELTEFVERWTEAFVARDGESIAGMMSAELRAEAMPDSDGYSFGFSSPWPRDVDADCFFQIYEEEQNRAEIYYYAHTSDPHVTCLREILWLGWENDSCVVTRKELNWYEDIDTAKEFREAYTSWGSLDGSRMDYTKNGLGETLNENALLSSSMAYQDLFEPKSAAAFLLNLSDDPNKVRYTLHEPEGSGLVGLDITFLEDRETFTISMFQPYGENGIWVPVDERIDVVARMMKIDREEWSGFCIGEIPEQEIRLYGYNDEEVEDRGVALEVGEDVYYFDWYYTSPRDRLPELYWDEERQELQISCEIYTGTGISAEEFHILRIGDNTVQESHFSLEDYCAILEERIDWSFDEETRNLILTDKKSGEALQAVAIPEEQGDKVSGVELGMISGFSPGKQIDFHVYTGYYVDDWIGVAEYENMPWLLFEVVTERRENGDITFGLGELITWSV